MSDAAYASLYAFCREMDSRRLDALRERDEARAKLAAVAALLCEVGCDCDCDHDAEGHDETCERCLACRVEALL